jgi:glycosyltransferase involved in cell wall biosynthesis
LLVIQQENLGLSLGYNIGIERARGRYIALGNADDEWAAEKLEKQVQAIQRENAAACFSAAQLVDDDKQPIPPDIASQFPFSFENLPRERMYEKFFFNTNFMCATSALIDRTFLRERMFDPSLIQLQDFELWVYLIKKSNLVILPEKLVYYRVRMDGHNLSLDKSNRARVLFELHLAYRKFFEDVDIAFFKSAFSEHLKNKDFAPDAFEFEKAFLYLKMSEPSIKALGIEMLYSLLSAEKARAIAARNYNLKIADLWNISKAPIYADSQSLEGATAYADQVTEKLRNTEAELMRLRESMRQITSGKLWKLREKVYGFLRGS